MSVILQLDQPGRERVGGTLLRPACRACRQLERLGRRAGADDQLHQLFILLIDDHFESLLQFCCCAQVRTRPRLNNQLNYLQF